MYCKHCGKQIADDSSFCQYCGEKVIDELLLSENSTILPANNKNMRLTQKVSFFVYKDSI